MYTVYGFVINHFDLFVLKKLTVHLHSKVPLGQQGGHWEEDISVSAPLNPGSRPVFQAEMVWPPCAC